jgi:hypothetical protein
LTPAPGQNLALRLAGPGWLGFSIFGVLLGLVVCSGFLAMPVSGICLNPEPMSLSGQWLLLWGIVLGMALFWLAIVWQLILSIRLTTIGLPVVEISSHPLRPGNTCDVLFAWSDAARFKHVHLLLVAEEQVTYREGTDTHTEKQLIHVNKIWTQCDEVNDLPLPGEVRGKFLIPLDAMHSFDAADNKVLWSIRVKGAFARWGEFDHVFPVVVYPLTSRETGA